MIFHRQKTSYLRNLSTLRYDRLKSKIIQFIITFFLIIALIVGINKVFIYLQIKDFILEGYNGKKLKEITTLLENKSSLNLINIQEKNLANEIEKIDPSVKNISIKKIFPNTIKINVSQNIPIAQIIIDQALVTELAYQLTLDASSSAQATNSQVSKGNFPQPIKFFIDAQGDKIEEKINVNPPTIIGSSEKEILTNDKIASISELIKELQEINFPLQEIYVLKNRIFVIKYNVGTYILMASDQSLKNQVRSLQQIVERFTIEGIKPKKIDLRFNKPVVVF